jgi:hypothetical protein
VPAAHAVQLPNGPVLPDSQRLTQSVAPSLPAGEIVPAGHVSQLSVVEPKSAEYLPATHSTQSDSSLLTDDVAYFPAPHCWHVPAPAAPTAVEYFPAPQSTQADSSSLPVLDEYLPALQSSHVPALLALMAVEYLPDPQRAQSVSASLPVVIKNLPAPHDSHVLPPVAPANVE